MAAPRTPDGERAVEAHPGDQYEVPAAAAHGSMASLKERIRTHYEIASDYYYALW